ncbi:MAG: hypothetical protein NUV64_02930 [Parcubacteria group bacterium]|nr:hypothetical protein [Parcubacteria group bacterium]MCR4342968.1 hypothetical protein [Patescibacteria group bacterium]
MILKKETNLGYFNEVKGIDLQRMAGILLPEGGTSGRVYIMAFDEAVSVREKVVSIFPHVSREVSTTIQSVSILPDGNVLFGITGNITSQVKLLVSKIAEIVRRDGLNGAYFPAYGMSLRVKFYISWKNYAVDAIKLPGWMKSVQPFTVRREYQSVLSKGIIFTDDKVIKEISLGDLYKEAWAKAMKIAEVKGDKTILYIDRVEKGRALVTVGGDIFALNLKDGSFKSVFVASSEEAPSAVLRLHAGVVAFITKKGGGINIFPSTSPESMAIAEAI